jgi:hypothetical protein
MAKKKNETVNQEHGETAVAPDTGEHADLEINTSWTADMVDGIIIGLHPNELVWKTDSGSITLSRLAGIISIDVPGKLSEKDREQIVSGLQHARIIQYDSVVTEAPVMMDKPRYLGDKAVLYRVLDERNIQKFGDSIKRQTGIAFLNSLYDLEKSDRNRDQYKNIILQRIKEIG